MWRRTDDINVSLSSFFSWFLHLNTDYCAHGKLSPILPLSEKKIPPINNTWFKNAIEKCSQNITSHTGRNIPWCHSLIVYYFLLYFIITIFKIFLWCSIHLSLWVCIIQFFKHWNRWYQSFKRLKKKREHRIRIKSLTILIKISSLISIDMSLIKI